LTNWLNSAGNNANNAGKLALAVLLYRAAATLYPTWSVPFYNLGLLYKNSGNWSKSMECNRRAVLLNAEDEGAWWNLAIAATALHDWKEARRAWRGFGLEMDGDCDEIHTLSGTACVRLNPNESGEVVWGDRIDPARIQVLNVPLPESKRRFRDILLNDGAPNGTRTSGGRDYPVFDELELWKASAYSTFEADLSIPGDSAVEDLVRRCRERDMGVEDWGTVRVICAACSRGNPGAHDCARQAVGDGRKTFGFAATSREALEEVIADWLAASEGATVGELRLALLPPTAA